MIRNKVPRKRIVDLTGPEGNAFVLLGLMKDVMKQKGHTPFAIDSASKAAESGDYEHLLAIVDSMIGDVVIFER